MKTLTYPFTREQVLALRAGDEVSVNGLVRTGRDRFHHRFASGAPLPCDFTDGALYHCGPVVLQGPDGAWRALACGPTTSVRENPYEPDFIAASGVRVIIGKGGMDERTLEACRRHGAVYLQAVGGAAALSAAAVERVAGVHFLEEFGAAEACWEFEMRDFRCVVGMDAHGRSLFAEVRSASEARFKDLIRKETK